MDAAGNRYVTGIFQGNIQFGATTLSTNSLYSDVFVAKIDPAGNYLWALRAGDPSSNEIGTAIALDASGNVYVTGIFRGSSITFGTTTLPNTSLYSNAGDVFVVKLTSSGQYLWAVGAKGESEERSGGIALDSQGNVFVAGSFESPQLLLGSFTLQNATATTVVNRGDAFIAKLDAAGKWLWAVRSGGDNTDGAASIAVDASGNAYSTGFIRSRSADFGSITLTHPDGVAAYVTKISPTGVYLWAVSAGGTGIYEDSGADIALDGNGGVFVTGTFQNYQAFFGPTSLTNRGNTPLTNTGTSDVFVARLDEAGKWRWAVSAGGVGREGGSSIVADKQGGVYLTGYYDQAAVQFGSTMLPYQGLYDDCFVAKLETAAGQWHWAVRAGGELNDVGQCVVLDAQQQVHVAGYYQSATLALPPFSLPGSRLASGLGFLTKLAPEPRVQITGDSLLCGASTQLVATAPAPVTAYRWSTGATTPAITVTQPGTYTVTITFASGLTSTAQFRVSSFVPTAQISGDSLLCPGASTVLTAVVPKPGAIYQWSTGATTPTISVTQPGTYSVTVRYGTTCTATAQYAVRVPTLRLLGDTQLCGLGSSVVLTALAPGATGLRWNTGATTASLPVTQAGTYSVVATFASGCSLTTSQVISRSALTLRGDTVLCAGNSATLTAMLTTPATYLWSTGATTPTIAVTQPGMYTVTARSTLPPFCTSTGQLRVKQAVPLPAFSLGADTTVCDYQALQLRAPSLTTPVATYRWSDGSTGASLRVTQPGLYTLQVSTPCETRSASRRISYRSCLLIPNIITPNGDHANDVFVVQGLAPGAWELVLYDRWGRQVFETTAYQHDWGTTAPAGLYYYLLRQADTTYKGWLEVVK
ncbi:gliding motility-associated C-terminal domain-containing protein (plasmid) [Hymenobacter sp. BRD128]|uniref:T9SS type B sorting domain-containing protein n=1 Tax=Hymenobacter sp. BRD128 TaxID=2675878 RepID=UPI0015672BE4|nr:gliding motility-associated C-terminal domain-containing protein [Hymenobacter sp. BRD128]QKG59233.1 gliding motility-associated C-terminal domain-containing protein [Hymenobacter sp. BRD128]